MVEGKEIRPLYSFIAGQCAGLCGLTASYPLDTIKIRLQTYSGRYKGMSDCFLQLYKKEGFLAFYRGLPSPAFGYGAINAVVFSTKTAATQSLMKMTSSKTEKLWHASVGGMCAGVTSSFIRGPVERIKTIMQYSLNANGTSPYKNTLDCMIQTYKKEGFRSIMAGTSSTMGREVLQYAVYFPAYVIGKQFLGVDNKSPKWKTAACGAFAGVVQWLPPVYCIDVIKSRIQSAPLHTYKNFWSCTKICYQKEGYMIFFRGLTPALVRAIPLHGTIFVTYEFVIEKLTAPKKQYRW